MNILVCVEQVKSKITTRLFEIILSKDLLVSDRQCCETLSPAGFVPAGGYCYFFTSVTDAEYDIDDVCAGLGTPGIELAPAVIQGDPNFEALLQNRGGKHYYNR